MDRDPPRLVPTGSTALRATWPASHLTRQPSVAWAAAKRTGSSASVVIRPWRVIERESRRDGARWSPSAPKSIFTLISETSAETAERYARSVAALGRDRAGPARFGELRVLEQRTRVAWFTGLAGPPESRTLVALCGSLSNLLGYCPPEGKQFVGWYPSAASGLDAFLRDAAGVESPIESYRWEDAVASRARLVDGIYLGRDSPEYAVSAEIDVLAQVHEVLSRAEIGPAWPNSEYDRIVLGAPLIVADAPARTRRERERDKSLRLRLAEKLAGRPLPPT